MDTARYGHIHGDLIDPFEFHNRATAKYKERGIYPYCDHCHEIVHLYGVHTTNRNTVARFDHANLTPGTDPLDDCLLANRTLRFRGLEPDGYDEARGIRVRAQFFEHANLALAYGFCANLCRAGYLLGPKFRSMLQRADRKRVWAYVGIDIWAIPYILLTLENFVARTKGGGEYQFHFSFDKPRTSNISALWRSPQNCKLVKLFTPSSGSTKKNEPVITPDNPYPVSHAALIKKAGDTLWITPEFLRDVIP